MERHEEFLGNLNRPTMMNAYGWRKLKSGLATAFSIACVLLAVAPLFLIFFYTLFRGVTALNLDFLIRMPKPVGETGGGMANALVGTGILVGLGGLFGLPVGILCGVYLAEYGKNLFGTTVRFLADVLSGVPSIVVGVVAYIIVVLPMSHFSALAGGVALGILMIPTVTRTTEEMMRLVPQYYREAGLALGLPQWRTTLRIILPTALKGITTGILLSLAGRRGNRASSLHRARE